MSGPTALPWPMEMYCGGVPCAGIATVPFYLPQYDTIWIPSPFIENCDNRPLIRDDHESRVAYFTGYEHEIAHRKLNYRTVVGFIHLTFTFLKLNRLFYFYPRLQDTERTTAELQELGARADAFFRSTRLWDETFGLHHTIALLQGTGFSHLVDSYQRATFKRYPFVKGPTDLMDVLLLEVEDSEEARGLFVASLLDAAAAVDPWPILRDGCPTDALPLDQNVDARFMHMLRFCVDQVKDCPSITVQGLARRLLENLEVCGISLGVQYDNAAYEEMFHNLSEDFLDGIILPSMYFTMTKQLLKDMDKLRLPIGGGNEFPVSGVTIRPSGLENDESLVPIMRELLLCEHTEIEFTMVGKIKVNVGLSFRDTFMLGLTADLLIRELEYNRILHTPRIWNFPAELLETTRRALSGEESPDKIERVFVSALTGLSF